MDNRSLNNSALKKYNPYICPLITAAILSGYLCAGLYTTNAQYSIRFVFVSFLVVAIWVILSVRVRILFKKNHIKQNIKCEQIILYILMIVLAVFFAYSLWGHKEYRTLAPIVKINDHTQRQDLLFHSMIAESFKDYHWGMYLVNDAIPARYHSFSHLLFGCLSRLLSVPAFLVYNYLYPIIFVPIYLYSQMSVISKAKRRFLGEAGINISDWIVIIIYNVGILTYNFSFTYQTLVSVNLAESMMISETIALFLISYLLGKKDEYQFDRVSLCVIIPIALFFISWTKISTGFITAVAIGYFIFRKERKKSKYLVLVCYAIIELFCVYFFSEFFVSSGGLASSESGMTSYIERIINNLEQLIALSIIPLVTIVLELLTQRKRNNRGKNVIAETIILLWLASVIPFIILESDGHWFLLYVRLISFIILIGRGYLGIFINKICKNAIWVNVIQAFLIGWLFVVMISYEYVSPLNKYQIGHSQKYVDDEWSKLNYWNQAMTINKVVGDNRKDYALYVNYNVFPEGMNYLSAIYLFPGLTGILEINGSYLKGDEYYTCRKYKAPYGWGLTFVEHDELSLEDAIHLAGVNNKMYLINIAYGQYIIYDCSSGQELERALFNE